MTAIHSAAGRDAYSTTLGKAAAGGALPLAALGAAGSRPFGAVPAAVWGMAGGLVAGHATTFLDDHGMSRRNAGIAGGAAAATAILGAGALVGVLHGGIGMAPGMALAALPAFGALTGGLTAAFWK